MRVKRSQLVPGCMLINDVTGKTSHPIIPKDTVLTKEHIIILKKFLVDSVHVLPKLANGKSFIPKEIDNEVEDNVLQGMQVEGYKSSIIEHYLDVVTNFKQMYGRWRNSLIIDIPDVRKLLIPLYERVDDIGFEIYILHKYASKDDYIYHHSVAVGLLSAYIARKMGYTKGESLQVGLAGFLSDCGMIEIDRPFIKENRSLTPNEWIEIKKHPTYSYRLIKEAATLSQAAKTAVLQHHERMDGSGYPLRLSKKGIHAYARIIAVCDMYHAMTSERLYKKNKSPFEVIELIQSNQFSKLDPEVVQTFLYNLANVLIGKRVQLSNNKTGEIIFIREVKNLTRPMIKIDKTDEIISLENDLTLTVRKIFGN